MTAPAVRLREVTKRYPGAPDGVAAVEDLDLDVGVGEVFTLLGANGAGKTTVIEMMVGLRRATSGTISTVGVDPWRARREIRLQVAVQPQRAAMFELQTPRELLRVWASLYPRARAVESVLDDLGLLDCAGARVRTLSGGQQQRLLVALALIARPRLLVLDEPSTGLDPNARTDLWEALRAARRSGVTIVLSTHAMDEAHALSDRIGIMDHGRLVACGSPEDLVSEHAGRREVLFCVDADTDVGWTRRLPGAVTVRRLGEDRQVVVSTTDSDAVLRQLGAHPQVRRITVRDDGLEGVFRQVTGRAAGRRRPADAAAGPGPGRSAR